MIILTAYNEIDFKGRVNRVGWSLSIMIGAMNVLTFVDIIFRGSLMIIGSEKLMLTIGTLSETISYLGFFLIPSWLFYVMSKNKTSEPIRFKPKFSKYLPFMILAGIGICLGASIVNDWFCTVIDYSLPYDDTAQYMKDPEIVALFMTVSLAPAFAEELLFRGVIYTNLRPYGKVFAVLTSSVMFGLMHQNVEQLLYTTLAGVCLAMIYEATGSIWGSVFLHMFNNLYAVLQTAVVYRYDEATAMVIIYLAQAVLISLGAISIIILLCVKRREDRKASEKSAIQPEVGFFGKNRHMEDTEHSEPVPMKIAFKTLVRAPGMICYLILAILSTISLVFMYGGGGYAL